MKQVFFYQIISECNSQFWFTVIKGRVDYEKDYAIITFESMMTDSDKKVGLLFEENGEISISWDHTNLQVIQFHFA